MMISAPQMQRAPVVILNSFQDPSLPARRAITVAVGRAQRASARPVPKASWILKRVQDDGSRMGRVSLRLEGPR